MAIKPETPGAEWRIARMGISLFLNNKTEEAEKLFTDHPHSFHVKAGRCFVLFMNAVMTCEDDKLQQAILLLKEMERECAMDIGWLKFIKSKVFKAGDTDKEYVSKLERQIVLADSQVCSAILTLLQQELTGYVRGGWMLRKAWRVYQHAYTQILQLHQRTFGTSPTEFSVNCYAPPCNGSTHSLQSPQSPGSSEWSIPSCNGSTAHSSPMSSPSGLRSTSEQQTPFVEPSEVIRLMSAVSFGYGIYQLCVSLLPPSLLKLIHFFGFEGDRTAGLKALMYARLSEDMRAPLATLSLLWYHTTARPFYALDGSNVNAGVHTAKQLINECHAEFQNSALFLFFAGSVQRLESNVNGALDAFGKAVDASTQREVKLLCLHEVAWCHLIRLNYEEAYRSFVQLQQQSRWSESFYAYLAAVCYGANGKFEELCRNYRKFFHRAAGTTKEKQLGMFTLRRAPKLVDQDTGRPYTVLYYRLLAYELLYLWNAMPSCSAESLRGILLECKGNHSDEPMVGLADLIEGAAHSYLSDKEAALKCYRNCLKRRDPSNDAQDQHISAFALYELGSILCTTDDIEEGRNALLKVQAQYKDYDFDGRLNVRIQAVLNNYHRRRITSVQSGPQNDMSKVDLTNATAR